MFLLLQDEYRKLLAGTIDFALQRPTQVVLTFRDVLGKLRDLEELQAVQFNFLYTTIEVYSVQNRFTKMKKLVVIPMQKGYLNPKSYRGFRILGMYNRFTSFFHLKDLQEIRPNSTSDSIWSHRFESQRLLITRIYFAALDSSSPQDTKVIVDCVPEYDKCAGENPCKNGGTCTENTCKCLPHFKGEDCGEDFCPKEEVCKNGKPWYFLLAESRKFTTIGNLHDASIT